MAASFEAKLCRAKEHLRTLDNCAREWVQTQPYRLVDEPDPYAHIHIHSLVDPPAAIPLLQYRRFRIECVAPVPECLSLVLGDCVHNLRSALDHLALALARKNKPRMTEKQVERSEFPVFFDRPMKPDERARKIGCVAPAARRIIEALQPHHRGTDYKLDPLWRIHELDRIDKHRQLALCAASTGRWAGFDTPAEGTEEHSRWNIKQIPVWLGTPVALERDAVVVRYAALPVDPHREVHMEPRLMPEVAFAPRSVAPMEPLVPTLQALLDFVRGGVLAPLSQHL